MIKLLQHKLAAHKFSSYPIQPTLEAIFGVEYKGVDFTLILCNWQRLRQMCLEMYQIMIHERRKMKQSIGLNPHAGQGYLSVQNFSLAISI